MGTTKPKPLGVSPATHAAVLAHGRYGTDDMTEAWGAEKTFEFSLRAQAEAIATLSGLYPDAVPFAEAEELGRAASLSRIDPKRIRELEEQTGHDAIAINRAWEEQVSPAAAAHINKIRTSADTTETAKALQLKLSLEVIADSVENLRDITLERSVEWIDIPHMDQTHLYDALPTVLGRPFSFYAEVLQSGLEFLKFVYTNSLVGKWADATGNHHSAASLGMDGMFLQDSYCRRLVLKHMTAPAQIPGREFITDVVYAVARLGGTVAGLAHYIRLHRGDDAAVFVFPRGKKGSSSMPHKDAKGGNPTREEQAESFERLDEGAVIASLSSCRFDYARDLTGSASDRVVLEDLFKCADHGIRKLAEVMYKIEPVVERCRERVGRSYGTVTSQQLMTYLTDPNRVEQPLPRSEAHELAARLATQAYDSRRLFCDVVLEDERVRSLLPEETIRKITDPYAYIGESKRIVQTVFELYHRKKTLA